MTPEAIDEFEERHSDCHGSCLARAAAAEIRRLQQENADLRAACEEVAR